VLERLGMLDKMKTSHFVKKFSVQFVNAAGKLSAPFYFWDSKPHECSQTWQVVRSEFDLMMLNNAREHGVQANEGVRVLDVLFDGDRAVGWCQLTPRDHVPWLDRTWRLKRVDDVPVWSLSCLYVRIGYRKRGVATALIAAALKAAKRAKAPALEAYPFDAAVSPSSSSTGYASTFRRAGFRVVARRIPARPIMRHDLENIR